MIRNRLSVIMAEKGLKITRVAKDTGISRNTITATSQNDSEMIRLETINTLCKYLNVTPGEFFEYEPIDINFSMEVVSMPTNTSNINGNRAISFDYLEADLFMDIDWSNKKESLDLSCELISGFNLKDNLPALESGKPLEIYLKIEFDDIDEKKFFEEEVYSKIDGSFYQDIYQSLIKTVTANVRKRLLDNIDAYSEKYLDLKHSYVGMSDQVFLNSMKKSVEQLKVSIDTDVFLPF